MQFGLKEATVEAINRVLAEFSEIKEAVLYGSRAKGNYKVGSDIDLTLKGEKLTMEQVWILNGKIDDLLLPYLFDISIYTQINSADLIEHIDRVGKTFYRKEQE